MRSTIPRSVVRTGAWLLALGFPAMILADAGPAPVEYPARFISHVTPSLLGPGSLFTVRGEGFGTSGSELAIGGAPCEVVSWTNTAVVARAPAGPASGAVTLTSGYPVEVSALQVPCTIVSWEQGVIEARTPESLDNGQTVTVDLNSGVRVHYGEDGCFTMETGDRSHVADCDLRMDAEFPVRIDFLAGRDESGQPEAGWETELSSPRPVAVLPAAEDALPRVDAVEGLVEGEAAPGQELTLRGQGFGSAAGEVFLGWNPAPGAPAWDPHAAPAEVLSWSDQEVRFRVPEGCLGQSQEAVLRTGALLVPSRTRFACVEPVS